MQKMLKLSALAAIVLTSGCVAVGPGQPRYAYGVGGYYSGATLYVPPPVRVYRPVYYSPPPTRVIVVRDRPYRSKPYHRPYHRPHGQGKNGR
jgi:hypothetical protein